MTDDELGGAAATADRLPCAEPGQLERFMAPIPDTNVAVRSRRVGGWHSGQDTVNKFCTTNPVSWCVERFGAGLCSRSVEWWKERVDRMIAAVECGCDPVVCPTCRRVGRTVPPCNGCRDTTGWEAQHLAELHQLKEVLDV